LVTSFDVIREPGQWTTARVDQDFAVPRILLVSDNFSFMVLFSQFNAIAHP
jgi:hypothetical protein